MKKKIVDADEPMGDVEVVADFLSSPAELAFKEDGVKDSHPGPEQEQLGFFQV